MSPAAPSIRRDVASGLVAVTIPCSDADPDGMDWFTLTLDALDDAGASARLTNDPSRGIVALERDGDTSDRFLGHLATALGVELAPGTRLREVTTFVIDEDLTTDDDIDALQTVYAATYGNGREMQLVIDLDDESVMFALRSTDAAAFIAHLLA